MTPELTLSQLVACMPGTTSKTAVRHLTGVRKAIDYIGADLSAQHRMIVACFLAQVGHECVSLRYMEEIASGAEYEGRADLGNVVAGDGRRFKGRGLIQVTGRNNYRACGKALGLDLVAHPELLATPDHAAQSAAWYWSSRGLNRWATPDRFEILTRRINGGINGLADREHRLGICRKVLAI